MKFSSFRIFQIEVFVKIHFPIARKIPLNPPFSKGEMTQRGLIPLFEKEGPGEILDNCDILSLLFVLFFIVAQTLLRANLLPQPASFCLFVNPCSQSQVTIAALRVAEDYNSNVTVGLL